MANQDAIAVMAKHLPPSASALRVLDVNGDAGAVLSELRADLDVVAVPGQVDQWQWDDQSVDAVVAYAYTLNETFLDYVLAALRPGGRLIVVDTFIDTVRPETGERLEQAGYTRILVEHVFADRNAGVLIRGEKPHTTDDTLDRIQQVATGDDNQLKLDQYRGRYVHLLVWQTPNVPIWARTPGDPITWKAAVLEHENGQHLLAFTSLPKAVGFMQPAVLDGKVSDINKVGKFKKAIASGWPLPILLNPDTSVLNSGDVTYIEVDYMAAEASDE